MHRRYDASVRRVGPANDGRAPHMLARELRMRGVRVVTPPPGADRWPRRRCDRTQSRDRPDTHNIAVAHQLVNTPAYSISRVTIIDAHGIRVIEPHPLPASSASTESGPRRERLGRAWAAFAAAASRAWAILARRRSAASPRSRERDAT